MRINSMQSRRQITCLSLVVALVVASAGVLPPPARAQTGSVGGLVSYSGQIGGTHNIVVVLVRSGEQQPVYFTVITGAGAYEIAGVADGSYTVFAFMDLDGDMGQPKPDEPSGSYDPGGDGTPDTVAVTAGNTLTGLDLTLHDPQPPASGMISGLIDYSGPITATTTILVYASRAGSAGPPAYHTIIPSPGPYTLTAVLDGAYTVGAYLDLDGDMAPPEPDEPRGAYDPTGDGTPDTVTVLQGSTMGGISFGLHDPWYLLYLPLTLR